MIDFSKKYYKEYFDKITTIKNEILNERFTPRSSLKIDWNNEGDSGCVLYSFKKIPKKEAPIFKDEYTSDIVKQFADDDNILAFVKITLSSGQSVKRHIDTCYWGKEFFRVHIPLMDTNACFYYGTQTITWMLGEIYFFDVRNVEHAAENKTNQDFEFISIDICTEESANRSQLFKDHNQTISEIEEQNFYLSIKNDID